MTAYLAGTNEGSARVFKVMNVLHDRSEQTVKEKWHYASGNAVFKERLISITS